MTKLVADLLTLARADSSVDHIIKEEVELSAIAEPFVRTMQPLALAKEITLELVSGDEIVLQADRERIGQLIVILLDNAIKYTPCGGRVEISLERAYTTRESAVIRVRDTGEGISTEDRERIFKRFYRVDKARSREAGGVGLGLSIAKWIVDAHKGKIKVESRPGQGSTFIVILPLR